MRPPAPVILASVALATLAGGCGLEDPVAQPAAQARPPAQRVTVRAPLQVANGPLQVPAAARTPVARLDREDRLRVPFKRPPRSGLLLDLDTGEVLWRRKPTQVLPIASLTKMMTALVVTDRLTTRDKALITPLALNYRGSGVGLLPLGERVRVETLLYGLLLPSGNDAARALAERTSGTLSGFIGLMNARATSMNLGCTRFSSPDGLRNEGNHSCATDLAVMASAVLDQPRLARIVGTHRVVRRFPTKGGKLYLTNTNPLLRTGYPGALGVKTGYTRVAGRCLVVAARRNGRRLAVVLIDSPDPATQARRLLDRGFGVRSG